ncbi:MAG: queuosine precursor transporter [Bacteroidaceae bacterium]|nr:queuosine precursor transporter [Bacteroidaceae bacterium]
MKQKESVSVTFMLLGVTFCVCLILANLLATKQIQFGPLNLTCGVLVFPISYVVNDCITEVWGFRRAKLIIWTGFVMNFAFVLLAWLADLIPGAPYWTNQEGFHALFGLAPRVALASFVAFLVGSLLNAYVMSRMKIHDKGRRFSLRAIASTVVGELADSLIFFPVALGGIVPKEDLLLMVVSQVVVKTLYEVVVLPITIQVVAWLKRTEGMDV